MRRSWPLERSICRRTGSFSTADGLQWLGRGFGLGLLFAGLATRFEIMERLVPVLTYAMIPMSGSLFHGRLDP